MKTRRHTRGQALVEFALVAPLFILILVGLFDVGRLVFGYHTANNAAREGGRQAVVDQTLAHIQERAADHAVSLGLEPADISVDFRDPSTPEAVGSCNAELATDAIYGCLAVVRVPYEYQAAVPIIGNLIGLITVTGEARFPVEFNCQEPTHPQCPVGA